MATAAGRFRLEHDGAVLGLAAVREGLRTRVTLWRDGEVVAQEVGLGKVLVPVPGPGGPAPVDEGGRGGDGAGPNGPEGATVLVLAVLPGVVNRALLLVPRPPDPDADADPADADPADADPADADTAGGSREERGGRPAAGRLPVDEIAAALPPGLARLATASRHPFAPPPGSPAARLIEFERRHPGLWASRHVLLALGKVALAVLGVWAFLQLVVRQIIMWVTGWLPDIDLPAIPWPDIDLPDIPWPDIDLPDLALPPWLVAVLATAKFWVPVLIAIGVATMEVRRRRRRAGTPGDQDGDDDRAGAGRRER